MTRPDRGRLTQLAIAFTNHGITDRDDRLLLCSDHAGRAITTMNDLAADEAAALARRLRDLPAGQLPAAVNRLRRSRQDADAHPA